MQMTCTCKPSYMAAYQSALFLKCDIVSTVSEEQLHLRLCSDSVLLIRREDVLKRLSADSSLSLISDHQNDPRWKTLNVEGTIKAVLSGLPGLLIIFISIEISKNNCINSAHNHCNFPLKQ